MAESPLVEGKLPLNVFPPNLRQHVDPKSSPQLRIMAAKGLVPMQPNIMLMVFYQLGFDSNPEVRAASSKSLRELPRNLILAVAKGKTDQRLLHFIARHFLSDEEVLELIIINQHTPDETIVWLAEKSRSQQFTELIATNQVRLLRCPKIIEKLYMNPVMLMSTADKIIDLAYRNGVKLTGLPSLQSALDQNGGLANLNKSGRFKKQPSSAPKAQAQSATAAKPVKQVSVPKRKSNIDFGSLDDIEIEVDDSEFAQFLDEASSDQDQNEDLDSFTNPFEVEEKSDNKLDEERVSKEQAVGRMNSSQKIRLSMLGTKEERTLLVKDSNKTVHMAAIQSPKVTAAEAQGYLLNRSTPDGVVGYIANNRDWHRSYPLKVGLVNHPKCPMRIAMTLLKHLRPNDMKAIAKNKNVPAQLARTATMIYRQKTSGVQKKK